jgi:hypothetical protein
MVQKSIHLQHVAGLDAAFLPDSLFNIFHRIILL